jgi:hypothetical protein
MSSFSDGMSVDMINDFKRWSRAIGGEDVMEGVEPDIKNYAQLGFCKDDFICDMIYSDKVNPKLYTDRFGSLTDYFFDGVRDDPEYTPDTWELAKSEESKDWMIQAKHSDNLYHETERMRKERNYYIDEVEKLRRMVSKLTSRITEYQEDIEYKDYLIES